ncbi:MAG: hypothetical protein ABSA82_05075 [Thermacetogeniaceae bacterium]
MSESVTLMVSVENIMDGPTPRRGEHQGCRAPLGAAVMSTGLPV